MNNKRKKHSKKLTKRTVKIRFTIFCLILVALLSIYFITVSRTKETNTVDVASLIKKFSLPNYTLHSAYPDDVFGVRVHTVLLDETSQRRTNEKRLIKYIVIHETGNKEFGTDAKSHSEYINENSDINVGWHYTVDEKEIYHHIPDNEKAWHAGDGSLGEGNSHGIGIELCVNRDGDFDKTFNNATKLVAYLLKEYNLDIDDIKPHCDFACTECPANILKDDRMDEFKEKVKKYL